MIHSDGFGNFLEQDGLPHSGRGDDKPALSTAKGRQQVHRTHRDGVRLWIFQDNSALRKLRRQFVKVRRFLPLFSRLSFDLSNLVEREKLLALDRQSYSAGDLLP